MNELLLIFGGIGLMLAIMAYFDKDFATAFTAVGVYALIALYLGGLVYGTVVISRIIARLAGWPV